MAIETFKTPAGVVCEDRANGAGFRLFLPDEPKPFTSSSSFAYDGQRFDELDLVMQTALPGGSTVIEGAPGSGKSNLIEDVEGSCSRHGFASLRLRLHVNGGKPKVASTVAKSAIEMLSEQADTSGKVLIVDNVDYVGYRGKSRTRTSAVQYAKTIVPVLASAIGSADFLTLGTCHNIAWQASHWLWGDPTIDNPQQELMSTFATRLSFEGRLATDGLAIILANRLGSETSKLVDLTELLAGADFHIANHIDLDLALTDPDRAIADVYAGRTERTYGKQRTHL